MLLPFPMSIFHEHHKLLRPVLDCFMLGAWRGICLTLSKVGQFQTGNLHGLVQLQGRCAASLLLCCLVVKQHQGMLTEVLTHLEHHQLICRS